MPPWKSNYSLLNMMLNATLKAILHDHFDHFNWSKFDHFNHFDQSKFDQYFISTTLNCKFDHFNIDGKIVNLCWLKMQKKVSLKYLGSSVYEFVNYYYKIFGIHINPYTFFTRFLPDIYVSIILG